MEADLKHCANSKEGTESVPASAGSQIGETLQQGTFNGPSEEIRCVCRLKIFHTASHFLTLCKMKWLMLRPEAPQMPEPGNIWSHKNCSQEGVQSHEQCKYNVSATSYTLDSSTQSTRMLLLPFTEKGL